MSRSMNRSVEELAREYDLPPWKVADAMVRLMRLGRIEAPENTTVDDHAAWLKTTYPKPANTK